MTCPQHASQMEKIGELSDAQKLQKDLYEMELERINFMLRNYLRDRLRKVRVTCCVSRSPGGPDTRTRTHTHITHSLTRHRSFRVSSQITKLALHLAGNAEAQACLSETEHEFVSGYVNLYQQHMDRSVWDSVDTSSLPDNLKEIMKCPTLGANRPAHAPNDHAHTHALSISSRECRHAFGAAQWSGRRRTRTSSVAPSRTASPSMRVRATSSLWTRAMWRCCATG